MFDPEAPPRSPAIAAALGPVRASLREALNLGLGRPMIHEGPRRLLVACSGGPDSVAALGLLLLLRRSEGVELGVAHVDHGLRAESGTEAAQVDALARELGLPSFMTAVALERGSGLPARARDARRLALRSHAREFGADWIVLGHTATDQAETMLMHIARGAGLDGLAAMARVDEPWLRPVLDLTRAQTRELAGELGLRFVDDPSNTDQTALRVRIRTSLLPILRDANPRLEQAMGSLARQAADADAACLLWADAELEARRRPEMRWDLAEFHRLPRAVRMRALRKMCEIAAIDVGELRARVIEALDAAAVAVAQARARGPGTPSPAPRHWDLHPRRRVIIDKNGVRAQETAQSGEPRNH